MSATWHDPPSPRAKILPLHPADQLVEPVDGLVALFAAADRVRKTLTERRRLTGWRAFVAPPPRYRGRPPIEATDPDAVVLVILAGPYPALAGVMDLLTIAVEAARVAMRFGGAPDHAEHYAATLDITWRSDPTATGKLAHWACWIDVWERAGMAGIAR